MSAKKLVETIQTEIGLVFSTSNAFKIRNLIEAWVEDVISDDESWYSPTSADRNKLRKEQRKRAGVD